MATKDIGFEPDWQIKKANSIAVVSNSSSSSKLNLSDLTFSKQNSLSGKLNNSITSPTSLSTSGLISSTKSSKLNSSSVFSRDSYNRSIHNHYFPQITQTQPIPKFKPEKLSKNRYGKEDMLLLYNTILNDDDKLDDPDIEDFDIHDPKPWLSTKGFMPPINLDIMSEQDQKMFQTGLNSGLSIKQFNQTCQNSQYSNTFLVGGGPIPSLPNNNSMSSSMTGKIHSRKGILAKNERSSSVTGKLINSLEPDWKSPNQPVITPITKDPLLDEHNNSIPDMIDSGRDSVTEHGLTNGSITSSTVQDFFKPKPKRSDVSNWRRPRKDGDVPARNNWRIPKGERVEKEVRNSTKEDEIKEDMVKSIERRASKVGKNNMTGSTIQVSSRRISNDDNSSKWSTSPTPKSNFDPFQDKKRSNSSIQEKTNKSNENQSQKVRDINDMPEWLNEYDDIDEDPDQKFIMPKEVAADLKGFSPNKNSKSEYTPSNSKDLEKTGSIFNTDVISKSFSKSKTDTNSCSEESHNKSKSKNLISEEKSEEERPDDQIKIDRSNSDSYGLQMNDTAIIGHQIKTDLKKINGRHSNKISSENTDGLVIPSRKQKDVSDSTTNPFMLDIKRELGNLIDDMDDWDIFPSKPSEPQQNESFQTKLQEPDKSHQSQKLNPSVADIFQITERPNQQTFTPTRQFQDEVLEPTFNSENLISNLSPSGQQKSPKNLNFDNRNNDASILKMRHEDESKKKSGRYDMEYINVLEFDQHREKVGQKVGKHNNQYKNGQHFQNRQEIEYNDYFYMPSHQDEFWFYKDPKNCTQGPFTSIEMLEWFRTNYFSEELLVRRMVDGPNDFISLGELMKMYRIPFNVDSEVNCFNWPVRHGIPKLNRRMHGFGYGRDGFNQHVNTDQNIINYTNHQEIPRFQNNNYKQNHKSTNREQQTLTEQKFNQMSDKMFENFQMQFARQTSFKNDDRNDFAWNHKDEQEFDMARLEAERVKQEKIKEQLRRDEIEKQKRKEAEKHEAEKEKKKSLKQQQNYWGENDNTPFIPVNKIVNKPKLKQPDQHQQNFTQNQVIQESPIADKQQMVQEIPQYSQNYASDSIKSQLRIQDKHIEQQMSSHPGAWGQITSSMNQVPVANNNDLREIRRAEIKHKENQIRQQNKRQQENAKIVKQRQNSLQQKQPGWSGLFGQGEPGDMTDYNIQNNSLLSPSGSSTNGTFRSPTSDRSNIKQESFLEIQQKERRQQQAIAQAQQKQREIIQKQTAQSNPGWGGWNTVDNSVQQKQKSGNMDNNQRLTENREEITKSIGHYDPAIKGVQTRVSNTLSPAVNNPNNQQNKTTPNGKKKSNSQKKTIKQNNNKQKNGSSSNDNQGPFISVPDELTKWSISYLKNMASGNPIDLPTFVSFLRDIEALWEVKDYVTSYFGDTKDARNFANSFVEKRISFKKKEELRIKKQKELQTAKAQLEKRKKAQEAAQEHRIKMELAKRKTSDDSQGWIIN